VRITQLTESERKTKRALLAARDRFRVAELAAEDARLKARDVNDGKDAALARSTRALAVGVGDIACLTCVAQRGGGEVRRARQLKTSTPHCGSKRR
jgi:hypothetical protein